MHSAPSIEFKNILLYGTLSSAPQLSRSNVTSLASLGTLNASGNNPGYTSLHSGSGAAAGGAGSGVGSGAGGLVYNTNASANGGNGGNIGAGGGGEGGYNGIGVGGTGGAAHVFILY